MKRATLGLFASLAFTGCAAPDSSCAPPDWNGTFVGPYTYTGECTDGTPVGGSYTQTVILASKGTTVHFIVGIGTQCTWAADIHDDQANAAPQNCTLVTSEGHFLSQSFDLSGVLLLDGDTLSVQLKSFITRAGSVNHTCNVTEHGTLDRDDG